MSGPGGRFSGGGHDAAKPNRWCSSGPVPSTVTHGEPVKPIKPHECMFCGTRFRNKYAMDLHVRELHGDTECR